MLYPRYNKIVFRIQRRGSSYTCSNGFCLCAVGRVKSQIQSYNRKKTLLLHVYTSAICLIWRLTHYTQCILSRCIRASLLHTLSGYERECSPFYLIYNQGISNYITSSYMTSLQCCYRLRGTAKTAEISLKECSAYGQIDQGGAEREETHIYEHPQ